MSIFTKILRRIRWKIQEGTISYEKLRFRAIQEIATIKEKRKVPVFESQAWMAPDGQHIYTNCYAYALNLPIIDKQQALFVPSVISNRDDIIEPWSCQELVEGVLRDLDFLGISHRFDNGETICEDGEYRIAIYSAPSFHDYPLGFHFVRQDSNGEWSEKTGWDGIVQKIGTKGNTPPTYDNGIRLAKVIIVKVF